MSTHIVPFSAGLLPQAGELLARRHARDRVASPVLPRRFEGAGEAQAAVETSLRRKHAAGFAGLDGSRLLAYLIGDMVFDEVWGRSGWIRAVGCAYDPETDVEIVRDLYACLGELWVNHGIFAHYAQVPAAEPELLEAWFSLSFGIEQIHALADLATLQPARPQLSPGLEVFKAGQNQRTDVASLSDVIWRAQVKAPVWAPVTPKVIEETADGWTALLDDSDVTVWLARLHGQVVGIQGYWPAESAVNASNDNMHIPDKCVHMSVAGTRAEARGRGIATLLTRHGLAQAYAEGYQVCDTDWRSTNLPAARFWPRQGFRPMVYRLVRRLDPRIAWANGTLPA